MTDYPKLIAELHRENELLFAEHEAVAAWLSRPNIEMVRQLKAAHQAVEDYLEPPRGEMTPEDKRDARADARREAEKDGR